jgi:hypothetical protein
MTPQKTRLTLFMLLAFVYASGQTIIPKAGVSVSTITGKYRAQVENQMGFTFGIAMNFTLSDRFSVQPEINFIQKGFTYSYTESNGWETRHDKSNVHINYIELPVLIKFRFGNKNKFFINGGPSLGYGAGGKSKLRISSRGSGVYDDWAFNQQVKFGHRSGTFSMMSSGDELYFDNRLDFGLQAGAGMVIIESIMIELRYSHGLTYLEDKDPINHTTTRNKVIQLTVGMPISK